MILLSQQFIKETGKSAIPKEKCCSSASFIWLCLLLEAYGTEELMVCIYIL